MKILLAIDGSKFSDSTTHAVAANFRAQSSEVLVLQVVEPFVVSVPPQMAAGYAPEQAVREQERLTQAKESVEHAANMLRSIGLKNVQCRVVESEVRTGILNVAETWHPDLIIVGSHGRKGLQKFLLGSTAGSIARYAPCSVWIVRNGVSA